MYLAFQNFEILIETVFHRVEVLQMKWIIFFKVTCLEVPLNSETHVSKILPKMHYNTVCRFFFMQREERYGLECFRTKYANNINQDYTYWT